VNIGTEPPEDGDHLLPQGDGNAKNRDAQQQVIDSDSVVEGDRQESQTVHPGRLLAEVESVPAGHQGGDERHRQHRTQHPPAGAAGSQTQVPQPGVEDQAGDQGV
jgi:hypothetical protein